MRPLSFAPLIPCVPVFAPLGAASWHGEPFLHIGLGVHARQFVKISVGFMRVSPYWQYETVLRTPPVSFRKSSMNGILRSMALGFSMNQYVGFNSLMILIVCKTSSMAFLALSVFGTYALYPPPQFFPMAATENPWHGGEAHRISIGPQSSCFHSRTSIVSSASN